MRRGDTALYQITLTTCFTNCNNSQTYLTRLPRKINICDGYLSKIYVGKQKKTTVDRGLRSDRVTDRRTALP